MRPDRHRQFSAWWLIAGMLSVGLWLALGAAAPTVTSPRAIKRFQVPEYYEAKPGRTNQLKSLIIGDTATPQGRDNLLSSVLIRGLQLYLYREDGSTNMVAEAERCDYSDADRCAQSDGPLRIRSGDDQLLIEGQGFRWQQTNAWLVISNDVRTRIQQENRTIDITARSCNYRAVSREVVYRDDVRLRHPQWDLTCGWLTAVLATNTGGIETLLATNQVRLDNPTEESEMTGDRLEYVVRPKAEVATITGQARWRMGERSGRADQFIVEREGFPAAKNTYTALGQTVAKLPSRGMLGLGGLLVTTNDTGTDRGTNGWVTIAAEESVLTAWPATVRSNETKMLVREAVFRRNIHVTEENAQGPATTLSCDQMRATFADTNQTVDKVEFEGHVVVDQGANQVIAQRGHYDGQIQITEFNGEPKWSSGTNHGAADRLQMESGGKVMRADGHAVMEIELGTNSLTFWPNLAGRKPPAPGAGMNRRLLIRSQRYALSAATAEFFGGVNCQEWTGERMTSTLDSQTLRVQFLPGNLIDTVRAEGEVRLAQYGAPANQTNQIDQELRCEVFLAKTEKGQVAFFEANQNVRIQGFTAQGGPTKAPGGRGLGGGGKYEAQGESLIYRVELARMELRGQPEVRMVQGRFTAPVIYWDQKRNSLYSPTEWSIQSNTNWMLRTPISRKKTP